ncbi:MAG: P-II family nitrogen regulator [Planctomycetaceae bacterium]|nr:P-II family nitrogen regulator [Planctomycetaceae bacterium]
MQNHIAAPAQILICFTKRHRGEKLVAAAKSAGARGGTLALGQSLGNSKVLQALSLADIQQDVIFTVTGAEGPAVVKAIRDAAEQEPRKFAGTALVLNVPELFLRKSNHTQILSHEQTRSTPMESGYKLITVIVNSGYADDVMAEARKAGASGGTIINARGTGTEEDVKFFGITLVPEKEMLLIVAETAKVQGIVETIATVPTLSEPGGGIIFNMNVEEFILLGQQKTWQKD